MATVLVIGDQPDDASGSVAGGAMHHQDRLGAAGWRLEAVEYAQALRLSAYGHARVAVLIGFPYRAWHDLIEERLPEPYGNRAYGRRLVQYMAEVENTLRAQVPGIWFLNTPNHAGLTRERIAVKRRWLATGVCTPPMVRARTPEEVLAALRTFGRLYVRAPSTSGRRGLSVLGQDRWLTNYTLDGTGLRRPRAGEPPFVSDDRWRHLEIPPGDPAFLSALCRIPRFLIEPEVTGPAGADRIEARVTVLDGAVLTTRFLRAPAGNPDARPRPIESPLDDAATARVEEAAIAAASALRLRYAVLQVLIDEQDRPWVIDADAYPGGDLDPADLGRVLDALVAAGPPSGRGRTVAAPSPKRWFHGS